MKLIKVRIKNYRSIKDSGDINVSDNLFVLAGQNESGKSSILEALEAYEDEYSERDTINFELEKNENLIQEIECKFNNVNEQFYNNLAKGIFEFIKVENEGIEGLTLANALDIKKISKIESFTLKRIFDHSKEKIRTSLELNNEVVGIIKSSIKEIKSQNEDGTTSIQPYLDVDLYTPDIADLFWQYSPRIILFNDFTTLLPDKILLSELENEEIEGQEAVKNLETLLNFKFNKISQKSTPQKNSTTESESKILSANFQEDWQQKIYGNNEVRIKFFIENNEEGNREILFYVETKDNEFLAPRKRSQGMIWFLSLWLELKSKENGDNLILLFDEPGMHLHIKAHKDILKVFHKLTAKGHQIIFSTHAPSLIETNKLHNIGLVINSEKNGTIIEGLTTSKINTNNKRDALQPIAEAMGMEPLKDFSILKKQNVLLEGLSDFWYFKAMQKVLNKTVDYEFIPGIGVKGIKIFHLISFCIGYNLDWLLVMDNGAIPNQVKDDLCSNLFDSNKSELKQFVFLTDEIEIEDLIAQKDLLLVDSTLKLDEEKSTVELIGSQRKVLFAKLFFQKVENNEIKKSHIQNSTIRKFEEIFNWIDAQFKNK